MNKTYNPELKENARTLRKNMTKEEKHLWHDFLKNLPVTVKRQKVIGKYIVDFYIASAKLVIELDGSQHYDENNIVRDIDRDNYLNGIGIKVLRYSNLDINRNFERVCQDILNHMNTSSVSQCSTAVSALASGSAEQLPQAICALKEKPKNCLPIESRQ